MKACKDLSLTVSLKMVTDEGHYEGKFVLYDAMAEVDVCTDVPVIQYS